MKIARGLDQPANPIYSDRQHKPEDQYARMLTGRARNRQDIVERHPDIGDDDLSGRLAERLARSQGLFRSAGLALTGWWHGRSRLVQT
jgi:hypothetical protein